MSKLTIALVGNPNCGKTTVFNALTGSKQRVGNWPGVTVDKITGEFDSAEHTVAVVDLPGLYSLTSVGELSLDQRIACDYMLSESPNVVVNIVDGSNLERNLYLTCQLLEMRVPLVVAVNMLDVARKRGMNIDLERLSEQLGCPVVGLEATHRKGIDELRAAITTVLHPEQQAAVPFPESVERGIKPLVHHIVAHHPSQAAYAYCLAIRLLEGDRYAEQYLGEAVAYIAQEQQQALTASTEEDADILIAGARYNFAHQLVQAALTRSARKKHTLTTAVDNVVLHRFWGIPIFLGVMYLMFLFAINIGGAFQDFFDIGSDTLFVQGLAHWLASIGSPHWLTAVLASGVGKGINTTVTFIPVIGAMFLFLALLERSGYMARAAFVMDRLMRAFGLPGKSFVPMIVGFGCNVPAIMAARTLENKRDRILTVMMSPFMSCGARLAIYAVFTAAFFPHGGQNVVFALYLIGIAMAVLTGLILRNTMLQGDASPLVLELPPYHMPTGRALLNHAWRRLKHFLFKAGKVIIPVCMLLGALNSLTINGNFSDEEANSRSVLSAVGRVATPVFAPMGIQQDNWPATVGLLTGTLAKEVVVGTLNTLYTQVGDLTPDEDDSFSLRQGLVDAAQSVPENLSDLAGALANPVMASAPVQSVNEGVYGQMYQRFDGRIGAFAYLLFVLLYFPCISATAAMWRELSPGWATFSMTWTTSMAYGVAVVFYQAATFMRHPLSSSLWIGLMLTIFLATLFGMKRFAQQDNSSPPRDIDPGLSEAPA